MRRLFHKRVLISNECELLFSPHRVPVTLDNSDMLQNNTNSDASTIATLGDRLKSRRLELGLTQLELATKAGVTKSAISNLETNVRSSPRALVRLAQALGTSVEWLSSGTGKREVSFTATEEPPSSVLILGTIFFESSDHSRAYYPAPESSNRRVAAAFDIDEPRAYLIRGDGLAPRVFDHEYIVVSHKQPPSNGDCVLIIKKRENENEIRPFFFRRFLYRKGNDLTVMKISSDSNLETIPQEEIDHIFPIAGILPDWMSQN